MFPPFPNNAKQLLSFTMSDDAVCKPVNHSFSDSAHQSSFHSRAGGNLPHPLLLLLLFLILLVFLLEPSTPNSLPAVLSIRRCDRGGRCVHNAAGVWLLRLHLSEGQSIPTPFLPFKASHSHRQTGRERTREEQGKEEEKSEWHESYFSFLFFSFPFRSLASLLYPPWTHCMASGSKPGREKRIERGRQREKEKRDK